MSDHPKNVSQQRGLRLERVHAPELVSLYQSHAQTESLRARDLILINLAHVLMLFKQGLITRQAAVAVLRVLRRLDEIGVNGQIEVDPRVGDLSTHMEAHIVREVGGEAGGRIHTGRSRNDLYTTLSKMLLRRSVLEVSRALLILEETLLDMARQHQETVLVGYTHHSQHAQPITLGHFLLGNFDVFSRDLDRIENLWPRLNRCPMGAAALAVTGFPLDRALMAELLGFDGIHEHSYDAISSKDFLLETLFILSLISSDLGRITESLMYWNTFEFGLISLSDEYASFSTVMPQKKNPVALETLRALNPIISGKLFNAFGVLKSEPWSNGRETIILDDDSAETGKQVHDMILLLNGILKTMKVNKDRMYELARRGFSTTTELADTLVRECGLSFRTAHEIISLVVKRAIDSGLDSTQITLDMLQQSAKACLGRKLDIKAASLRRALDPRGNVQVRTLPGGPASNEVKRMIRTRQRVVAGHKKTLAGRQSQITRACESLRQRVAAVIGEASGGRSRKSV